MHELTTGSETHIGAFAETAAGVVSDLVQIGHVHHEDVA